ncbi:(2Fe-2S)-binding protein [Actinacidiphila epipremni]|uniref:(2Fe-2S)-binding protein n=1 Tax=Actinacidiphila epipremni TaxID=2053013 RepID=A0ABX0ZDN1_9ACTN|nr:(2Fe-2S)-binding protein [Actinacidiphila epipremni]NJP41868.1 (2Fe-2S)-binding protein [Actinacidiphila epipremni]
MTDQPQQPGPAGNSGAWQPVPGGGDYDPDQTMHVSFAAQLPPQPRPGEDPLIAHGPVGEPDAATTWTIPVIREDGEGDSGEYSAGAFTSPWDQAPSPAAPTQSFPAGMFGQGAAAAQAAQAQARAEAAAAAVDTGQSGTPWSPFGVPEAVPWTPVDPAAAEAAWSSVVDEVPEPAPEGPPPHEPAPEDELLADRLPPAAEPLPEAALEGEPSPVADTRPEPLPEHEPVAEADPAHQPDADAGHAADYDGDYDGDHGYDPGSAPAADTGEAYEAGPGHRPEYAGDPPAAEDTRSEHPLASYVLRVNGTDRPVTDAWLGESLLYVLRERLGLAGAKDGCEQGECGACSVQVDGRLVASCLVPAATAAGSEVLTVEGLSADGRPSDIQQALADCGAVQCGFCIPGMAMTVHDLLEGNHRPTDLETRQALCGNLCRCSGYRGVVEAVRQVVGARDAEDPPPPAPRIPAQPGPASPEASA